MTKLIKSRFDLPESIPESDFPKEIPDYEMVTEVTRDKQVIKKLVESDKKINIYDKIQADNHGLTVKELIKRYAAGDPNVRLNIMDWNDGDFTGTTMFLVEMQAALETAQSDWDNLPIDVREHYGHDVTKFLNGIDTGELNTYLISRGKSIESVKEGNVNESKC